MTDKIIEVDWENQWYDIKNNNILYQIKQQNDTLLQHFNEKNEEKEEDLKTKVNKLEQRLDGMEKTIDELKNENLKLINRMLEAEVSLERYKNLMLRKHITFPFSKFTL